MRTEPLYARQRSAVRVRDDAYSVIQGVYCLSDDGHHQWSTTVSALQHFKFQFATLKITYGLEHDVLDDA